MQKVCVCCLIVVLSLLYNSMSRALIIRVVQRLQLAGAGTGRVDAWQEHATTSQAALSVCMHTLNENARKGKPGKARNRVKQRGTETYNCSGGQS